MSATQVCVVESIVLLYGAYKFYKVNFERRLLRAHLRWALGEIAQARRNSGHLRAYISDRLDYIDFAEEVLREQQSTIERLRQFIIDSEVPGFEERKTIAVDAMNNYQN